MYPRKNISLKARANSIKKWAVDENNRSLLYERATNKLCNAFEKESLDSLLQAASSMDCVSIWLSMKGAAKVIEKDETGWSDIINGIEYLYWSIKIFVRAYEDAKDEKKQSAVLLNTAAICLADSLSLNCNEIAAWLGERLLHSYKNNDGAFNSWALSIYSSALLS